MIRKPKKTEWRVIVNNLSNVCKFVYDNSKDKHIFLAVLIIFCV